MVERSEQTGSAIETWAHVSMADPVCSDLSTIIENAARDSGAIVHRGGTYVCMEGPQFSSRSESYRYRDWDASIIGMTNMPEASGIFVIPIIEASQSR